VVGLIQSLGIIWRIAIPYFRSEDRRAGRALLIAAIVCDVALVGVTVLLNKWYNGFYGSLQDRDWHSFVLEIAYFCGIAAAATLLTTCKLYINLWLQIRWRRWMTKLYLNNWLEAATHYRMEVLNSGVDNPDQRISEDIKLFIEKTLSVGLGFLSAIALLTSFIAILWMLSDAAPLQLLGATVAIPGYLVWAAIIYAVFGTVSAHLIGWRLIGLNFNQQRYEADFRFNLVRVRENSEQIALLGGEPAEADLLLSRFGKVVANWYLIMSRQKWLTFFTAAYSQSAIIVPIVVVSPIYFAGAMQLGGLVQTSTAFTTVHTALSFFVTIYVELAEWRAVIARLDGFDRSIAGARATATPPPGYILSDPEKAGLTINELSIYLPTGAPLVATENLIIQPGQRALITGPSGSGKSTFFRAVAGIWPFKSGTVVVPRGAKLMVLPQRPYFLIASLEDAVTYPSPHGTFKTERIVKVLRSVGLPALAERLSEEAHWNQILSLGEQQRLSMARAILQAPDYLFLDEATASLDEQSEATVYLAIQEQLPGVTVVSIGHRSTLIAAHNRHLTLHPGIDRHLIRDVAMERAAL
jgi:putative ATP-binding cassette transporter